MKTRYLIVSALVLLITAPTLGAQTIPDGAQALRTDPGYRRTPTLRNDPFRNVMFHHWGLVISSGALVANNTLNVNDMEAIWLLAEEDEFGLAEVVDIGGLIPLGAGLSGFTEGMGKVHFGGPLGGMFAIGFSAGASGFGSFDIDDQLVTLFRDGNGNQEEFQVGDTQGTVLATAEYGVHATLRTKPLGSPDGPRLTFGFGGRVVKPLFYGSGASALPDGGTIRITNSGSPVPNISANINFESYNLPEIPNGGFSDYLNRGSGFAADFLGRIEWPTSGFAAEIMVANIGTIDIQGLERRVANLNVSGSNFDQVYEQLQEDSVDVNGIVVTDASGNVLRVDTLSFDVQDTVDLSVKLPRIVRVTASAWANRILQIDISATAPVTGDFDTPAAVDIGTTWRFLRVLPIRLGVMLGGAQGLGYTGGFGIEGRNFLLQFMGGTLGGLFGEAKGAGGRFEFGVFF